MANTNLTQPTNKMKSSFLKSNPVFADYFKTEEPAKRPISTTIQKPLAEVAALLGNIKNLPNYLENLEKVEAGKDLKSTWHFRDATAGEASFAVPMRFEDVPGEGVIWSAEDAAGFKYSVAVQLQAAQAGRGTVVRMMTAYETKTGALASAFEKMFGANAELSSKKNLQRFKAFCETGHVPTIEGQSSGRDEDLITVKH
jgi:uncharacterized membrane protein